MKLKANFSPVNKLNAFYLKGQITTSDDGKYLLCGCSSVINMVDSEKGFVTHSLSNVDDAFITCFIVSPNGKMLITSNQKAKLRQWDFESKTVKRTWSSGHNCPVSSMDFDSSSTLLCTGASDGAVRVYDLDNKTCTNLLKGHSGVVRIVKFNPGNPYELYTTCDSYDIKVWDLKRNAQTALFQGHFSAVTSLQFSSDFNYLYSSGRDKVVIMWGLENQTKKVIPIYECIESMIVLPASSDVIQKFVCLPTNEQDHLVVAGPSGKITIWNAANGRCVAKNESFYDEEPMKNDSEDDVDEVNGFIQVFMLHSYLVGVTVDQNIIFYNPEDLTISHQFVGNNGSILDLKFFGSDHLAMATNTNQLKLLNIDTGSYVLAKGHKEIIMCVDLCETEDNECYLVTGSKDNTVMIWTFDKTSSTLKHHSIGEAHTNTVNGVSIIPTFHPKKMFTILSCSTDKTLKLWNYFPNTKIFSVLLTTEAHEDEINSVTCSPNSEFIASASKDKTAKMWSKSDLSLIGTFKGHKRGVWSVQFSPTDRILATSSNDSTIKLWDITSFSCIKTFEGHESGVQRVLFLTNGMQLMSCGSDGLMKLWTIKTNECIKTFDAHDDKIWAMAVDASGNKLVTGAGDGALTTWKDVTEEEKQEAIAKSREFLMKEQELMNLLHSKQYNRALELALLLNQPKRALDILKELIKQQVDVSQQLSCLNVNLLDTLLGYSVAWNQNSKNCAVAQLVLSHVLRTYPYAEILKTFKNITKVIEGMIPYTERHYARIKQHLCKSAFAECLLQSRGLTANTIPSQHIECQADATVPNQIGSDSDSDVDMDTN